MRCEDEREQVQHCLQVEASKQSGSAKSMGNRQLYLLSTGGTADTDSQALLTYCANHAILYRHAFGWRLMMAIVPNGWSLLTIDKARQSSSDVAMLEMLGSVGDSKKQFTIVR